MDDVHTGGCACGAVRFVVRGPLGDVGACHCSQCRRQTGLYYATTNVADGHLDWEGLDVMTRYRSSPEADRGFCSVCGSALYWKADGSEETSLMAGAFDQPSGLKIAYHIFCADKADFYEIEDGLPQFAQSNS
ncbi:GFA family protein [Rhizobium sp. 32-5/1]|uniref:GFA family protein n=1 Tax=Rhizobium sp. 32-5/1 TaxID=3019602 RepID=UPI00240D69A9|nr:GFA family protein [Rhizobium sp. 32-5/1]WEZ83294.1 GFA family protein [Rhizobium sp. 32-5/1]